MKKATRRQDKEIQALQRLKHDQIDLTDIPPLQNWNKAVIGKFYRPIKKSLTLRIDADVLAWLRSQGKGYQTRINALLREAMNNHATDYPRAARRRGPSREAQESSPVASRRI